MSAAKFSQLMTYMGIAPMGICPSCLSLIELDHEGNLKLHSATRYGMQPCSGVGLPPKLQMAVAPAKERK